MSSINLLSDVLFRSIARADDELVVAQMDAIKKRIPLLYLVLGINVAALAYTHHGYAPAALTLAFPAVAIALMLLRLVFWYRLRKTSILPDPARRQLIATTILGAILGTVLLIWALLLYNYETNSAAGHITGHGHVAFFIGITVISCIFLMMHLQFAALSITFLIIPPFCLYLLQTREPVETAIAVNLFLVSISMLYVLLMFGRDFKTQVLSKAALRELNNKNAALAHLDTVTPLANRRSFLQKLEELHRGKIPHAVAIIDLDDFKPVNDLYGHFAGDEVLRQIGQRITESLPANSLAARLGGDEFAFVMPQMDDDNSIQEIAEKLILVCQSPIQYQYLSVRVGVSIGLSMPQDQNDTFGHLERADYALSHAKQKRGAIVFYTPNLERERRRASEIEIVLKRANFVEEIDVVFQPIVDAKTSHIAAFEALARWNSKELGAVSPADFIAVAERSEVIHSLTIVVLQKAIAAALDWPDDVRIKINISARDLMSHTQMIKLVSLVENSGILRSRVSFEVTETSLANDLAALEATLLLLNSAGISIVVDDFGVGYSSLTYIHRLAPRAIKLDRSFISDLGKNTTTTNVVRTILELCRNIGAISIAEGVETEQQIEILRELGCDKFQGFFLQTGLLG